MLAHSLASVNLENADRRPIQKEADSGVAVADWAALWELKKKGSGS